MKNLLRNPFVEGTTTVNGVEDASRFIVSQWSWTDLYLCSPGSQMTSRSSRLVVLWLRVAAAAVRRLPTTYTHCPRVPSRHAHASPRRRDALTYLSVGSGPPWHLLVYSPRRVCLFPGGLAKSADNHNGSTLLSVFCPAEKRNTAKRGRWRGKDDGLRLLSFGLKN